LVVASQTDDGRSAWPVGGFQRSRQSPRFSALAR
jgi:hypothetical protein